VTKDEAQRRSWTFYEAIILGEAKEEQFPLFEPTGRVWKLPEASLRMVKKSFQRAKGDFGNSPLRCKEE
jgi:hypothetical protein